VLRRSPTRLTDSASTATANPDELLTRRALLSAGIGASLSNLTAGFVVEWFDYPIGFLYLAAIAICGLVFFATFMPETRPAQRSTGNGEHMQPRATSAMAAP
jgi:hypothetical protein